MNRQQRREASTSTSPPRKETPADWFEAGLRLFQAGQIADAEKCGRSALALDQSHADSLHLMGLLCMASKQYDLAIEWFAVAIRQNPAIADYFANLGTALHRKGRHDEAIRSFDRALVLDPGQAAVWSMMGELLRHEKRLDEAILSFDQALNVKPDYFEAANSSAMLYFETGRYEAAIARFTRSLEIDQNQAPAFNLRGISHSRLRRYEEALDDCLRGVALAPDNADFNNNVGLLLQNLGRHDEALAWVDKALALRPEFAEAFNIRSISLFELRRCEDAFASMNRAIEIEPERADYHWNLALMRLRIGDFDAGWVGREWGAKVASLGFVDRKFTRPQWKGGPIAGKTILLHSDEGLGDTIQFSRYAAMVSQLGARVILEVEPSLHGLLTGLEGVAQCLPRIEGVELPAFDLHCPLSGLPLAFKTRLDTIPGPHAYLPPLPEARVKEWRARLGAHDRLRVGLVWSGNPLHTNDRNRSTNLQAMSAIFDVGARFYSLQKEPREADQAVLAERSEVVDLTEHLGDFTDTSALIACLDLVITVDTSVAHLSAAQGRPTWILLPFTPDYRWLLGRDDSPWYPGARLFRQDESRDYTRVLARVREELKTLVAAFEPQA
ncbi:MAG TPA: tetratricopeptide repeat-containing glycosyltransferase family protein [Bradyrhizobium sp.]|jgi:tetratricopeptide (TPR) repeat protein